MLKPVFTHEWDIWITLNPLPNAHTHTRTHTNNYFDLQLHNIGLWNQNVAALHLFLSNIQPAVMRRDHWPGHAHTGSSNTQWLLSQTSFTFQAHNMSVLLLWVKWWKVVWVILISDSMFGHLTPCFHIRTSPWRPLIDLRQIISEKIRTLNILQSRKSTCRLLLLSQLLSLLWGQAG